MLQNIQAAAAVTEQDHKRALARKHLIEKRKEEQERRLLEKEREAEEQRLQQAKATEEAEERRRNAERCVSLPMPQLYWLGEQSLSAK